MPNSILPEIKLSQETLAMNLKVNYRKEKSVSPDLDQLGRQLGMH